MWATNALPQSQETHMATKALSTSDEVLDALDILAAHDGSVVERFHQAFEKRSKLPELCESQGVSAGLVQVLAGLLRRTPPDSYLGPDQRGGTFSDAEFMQALRNALVAVAERYSQTFVLMKKHQQEKHCTLVDVMRALFARYADNQDVYPH